MSATEYDHLRSVATGLMAALAGAVADGEVDISDGFLRGQVLEVGLRLQALMDEVAP